LLLTPTGVSHMTNLDSPWIVETSEDHEVFSNQGKAIGVAEDFQLKGKDVCIYHDGQIKHKFSGHAQGTLGLNYDRFLV